MKRAVLLMCVSLLAGSVMATAQEAGRLTVTVQAADAGIPAAPSAGAKIIVVHWANSGLHPALVQDQAATTNQMGTCTLNLPPGIYDVFISASGLSPAAFRREIRAGENTSLAAPLRSAPLHLSPVQ